jgi:ketosteroid isomerase-like protein
VARDTRFSDGHDMIDTTTNHPHLITVRAYLAALEGFATGDALAVFFTPDVVQVELPNRLNPNGGRSDLSTLMERSAKVPAILRRQSYAVVSETVQGDRVIVEAVWTGVLAIPLGTLAAGATMTAHFAMVFEFRDGRIAAQRNYDCFEPF